MDGNNPAQQRESMEIQSQKPDSGIDKLKRLAEKITGEDKNKEHTAALANLDVLNPRPEDKDALTFMQSEILNVITKIGKKFPEKSLDNVTPGNVADIARDSGIEIRPSETIALSKLAELGMNPENQSAKQMNAAWQPMLRQAEEARNGLGQKYLRRLKEKPGETLIYTAAGAAGIYLGYKLIKWLAGKGIEKAKDSVKSTAGEIFSTGNILAALGLIAGGAFLGKDAIKDFVSKKLGIASGAEQLTKQLNEISEKISKAQNPEEVQKLKKEAEDLIAKAKEAGKELKEKHKDINSENLMWMTAEEMLKRKLTDDEKEQAKQSSEYLKSLDVGIEIKPQVMALIGAEDYENLLKNGSGIFDVLLNALSLDKALSISGIGEIKLSMDSRHISLFFREMLKNKGEFDEFKGKTVNQVITLIKQSPDKYFDKEALAKAKEKDSDFSKALSMLKSMVKDKEKMKDRGYVSEILARLGRSGYTLVTETGKEAVVWVVKNGARVGFIEGEWIVDAMHWWANDWMKDESYLKKVSGTYMWVGAYTMAIGAPLGGLTGFAKGYMHGTLGMAIKESVKGQVKGAVKGILWPGKAVAGTIYEWGWNGTNPLRTLEGELNWQRFIAEDIKLGPIGYKFKNWFGANTLSEKIVSGQIEVNNNLMRRLEIYRQRLEQVKEDLTKNVGREKIRNYKRRVEAELKRIEKIQDLYVSTDSKGKITGIDEVKWEKEINKKFSSMEESYRSILKTNKRIGSILMLNEDSHLAEAIMKRHELIGILNENDEIFELLVSKTGLIDDVEIQKILEASGKLDASELKSKVKERSKFWKRPDKVETEAAESVTSAGKAAAPEAVKTTTDSLLEAAKQDAQSNPTTETQKAVQDLQELKTAENAAKSAEPGSDAASKLASLEKQAAESVETAGKAMEAAGKTSKLWQTLKLTGKIGFGGLAGVGAAVSLYESGKGFYEAATTNVKGRAGIESANAALLGVSGAADVAFVATMIGAKGAALSVSSTIAAPLAPIAYAGSKIYESYKEGNLTEAEWGQKYNYDSLMHEWFSTSGYVSLGDAWVTGFGMKDVNESLDEKKESYHKIYRVLVALRNSPELMSVMYTEKPSKEKDKKIEKMIESSYTKYHEYYFRQEGMNGIKKYGDAQAFIANACMFSDIMNIRNAKKEKGEEFKIGSIELTSDNYDFVGDAGNPVPKKNFFPSKIIEAYKNSFLDSVKKDNPVLSKNLEKTETPYLLLLYVQMTKILAESKDLDDERVKFIKDKMAFIRDYLQSVRNINVNIATQNNDFYKPNMKFAEITENINGLAENNSLSYRLFEKANTESRPEVRAIYRLAQFFGYTGFQKENELKEFFNEQNANYHGIYWNDKEWVIQKAGMDFDKKIGRQLNPETIHTMITELVNDSENIIEHRQDTVFANAFDYSDQVKKMASILENGYNEAVETYKTNEPRISIIGESAEQIKKVA